jgi:hypothetical protein
MSAAQHIRNAIEEADVRRAREIEEARRESGWRVLGSTRKRPPPSTAPSAAARACAAPSAAARACAATRASILASNGEGFASAAEYEAAHAWPC